MQISGLCGSVGRSKFAQITYGSAAIEEFVAQMLSVRLTTSTLLAQVLQNKGMIKYSSRIVILDRSQLEACACECYHLMRDTRSLK